MADPNSIPICCPRCGYDQRGVVATWVESCPLDGICTECGVELFWPEVLRPKHFEPRWAVEFIPRRVKFFGACLRTFLASLWPWGFWTRMRMSFEVRWRRLLAYGVVVLLPLLMTYLTIQVATAIKMRLIIEDQAAQMRASMTPAIANIQARLTTLRSDPAYLRLDTRQKLEYVSSLKSSLDWYQSIQKAGFMVRHSYAAAVMEAVFTPGSESSKGTIKAGFKVDQYPSPSTIHASVIETLRPPPPGGWFTTIRVLPEAPPLIVGWLSYCGIYALMPLLFLLLPFSRRRGKVRWRHIVRVWIYGLWIPTVTGVSLAAMLVIGAFDNEWWSMIDATIRGVPTWGFGLLIIAWWWSATGRYLRMPHALAIAALLAVLGGLIVLAVIWFGWREFLIEGSWLFSL